MRKIPFLFLLLPTIVLGQNFNFLKDTSFTVFSAYQKDVKKFPNIKIIYKQYPKIPLKVDTNVVYTTQGRPRHLDIFAPSTKKLSAKGYPAVLLIHGGGWKTGDRTQTIPMALKLTKYGFAAIVVEYRLSPEAPYPAAVHDLKAAIRWIRANANKYHIDTTRIAGWGFSAGGQLSALLGATNGKKEFEGNEGHGQHSSVVQAVINMDGILAFKHPESEEGATAAMWLGGSYEEKPDTWKEASALTHVGPQMPPTLFLNSSLPRFHAGREDMIHIMDSLKIYTEVHTFPNTPHTFSLYHPWFEQTVQHTVSFLRKIFNQEKKY